MTAKQTFLLIGHVGVNVDRGPRQTNVSSAPTLVVSWSLRSNKCLLKPRAELFMIFEGGEQEKVRNGQDMRLM